VSEATGKKRGLPLQVKMRHDNHFVEELTERHAEEPIGRMVALSSVEPDPEQPRSSLGELDDLTASVRDKGVLEPILVHARDGESGQDTYRIISGERRYRAAQAAGLREVPVIEMRVSKREALEIALVENLQRKDLTPFEEAEGYAALGEQHGYTHEQIADAVGRSRSIVTETLALLQIPARIRQIAQALGIQSKTLLLEVVKAASSEAEMVELLERAAGEGLNREDLRKAKRRKKAKSARARDRRGKPYVFNFRDPEKSFKLALTFRKSAVDREDLIDALEQILSEIKAAKDPA
jgi:ParB family chromosome partitioning protein